MYNNIPYKNIDGKKFVDFENLNYSPTKENAETLLMGLNMIENL